MKHIILTILFIITVSNLYGQVGVVILEDSPNTLQTRIQDFIHQVELIQNTVEQIQLANTMLQNQIKSIEALSEGDFESFVEAFSYQTASITQFSDLINGFDYLKEIEDLQAILDSDDFNVFRTDVQCISDSMRASNNLLHKTLDLVKNTEYRIDRQKDIHELSKRTSSITGQLQLTNESLGLLSSELQDILLASVAMNNLVATEEKNKEIQQEMKKKYTDDFFDTSDSSAFESEVSEEQFNDAIFGRLDDEE